MLVTVYTSNTLYTSVRVLYIHSTQSINEDVPLRYYYSVYIFERKYLLIIVFDDAIIFCSFISFLVLIIPSGTKLIFDSGRMSIFLFFLYIYLCQVRTKEIPLCRFIYILCEFPCTVNNALLYNLRSQMKI